MKTSAAPTLRGQYLENDGTFPSTARAVDSLAVLGPRNFGFFVTWPCRDISKILDRVKEDKISQNPRDVALSRKCSFYLNILFLGGRCTVCVCVCMYVDATLFPEWSRRLRTCIRLFSPLYLFP